jgi:hypothetical protein
MTDAAWVGIVVLPQISVSRHMLVELLANECCNEAFQIAPMAFSLNELAVHKTSDFSVPCLTSAPNTHTSAILMAPSRMAHQLPLDITGGRAKARDKTSAPLWKGGILSAGNTAEVLVERCEE